MSMNRYEMILISKLEHIPQSVPLWQLCGPVAGGGVRGSTGAILWPSFSQPSPDDDDDDDESPL